MAVQVPPEVNWLLDILCGQSWPEGDEDALRRCAQAWQEAAQALGDLAGYLDSSAQNVLASADSMSADDYANFWKNYIHDGDGTYVALFKQCEPLVKQLFAQATEVEYTKIVIVVTLILTAIQIAIAIAAAVGTFGGSLAEVGLAMFIGRETILMVVARFVEMALMMLIPDLVAQTVMFAQGHGWDGSKTVGAFENALAAGTIAAVLGPLAGKLPWMSEEAAQTIGGKLGALATHFVEGGAVNDLTALATMGTNYGLASLTGNQDWQKQIAQQWSSTNWVAQFAQGGVLADAFYVPHMFGHDGVPMTFTGSDGKSYTVHLDDAAFTSLRDTGQLPAGYQARVFGDNGVQVGDATFNGTAISFDKPISGQPSADLGNGFTVAGHDGSQFRFQPSDQTGPDGQPQFDLVSRVQKSADPITVQSADAGGNPLEFPPGAVVHYDNMPGPDGTMTGQPYRVEVTDGNVVKIYQAEQPGGPFELTGQVVHSSGILRFFGADAPKYYGADGSSDGAQPLATVSLITGKSTTNDLAGYINAHADRWGPAVPTSTAGTAGPHVVDGTVVTPANDGAVMTPANDGAVMTPADGGQRAGQEADPAAAAGLVDASAFAYAQQVQQMLQNHPELFIGLRDSMRGGAPRSPAGEQSDWPQFYRTGNHEIPVPRELADLAETDVAARLADNRHAYEVERKALEDQYRLDIRGLEDSETSPHTLRQLDQARQDLTDEYQRALGDMAAKYEGRDREILTGELTQMQRFRLAGPAARINEALEGGLHSQYKEQLRGIDAQLAQELAVRRHMDLDRLYVPELERLDAEWARAEGLPGPERLQRFAELSRQLRDLEVGLYRQHEALRIGPEASEARRWVRDILSRALKDSKVNGAEQPHVARQEVIAGIDERVARLEQQAARTPAEKQAPLIAEAAELRKIAVEMRGGGGQARPDPLHPVTRWPAARVEADVAVADAVDHVLASLPPERPGGGSRVHAAFEMVGFDVPDPGPTRINSGTAVPEEPSRWVDNAAGGLLNYVQMRAGVPGELRVGSLADRRTDAEFQIVAQVRARLAALRAGEIEPVGVVVIGADKLMCPSCQMALHELMGEFPGVQVVLASSTVTVILDPASADVRALSDVYGPGYGLRADVVPLEASAAVDMGPVAGSAKFLEPATLRTDVPAGLDLGALARHRDGLADAAPDAPEYRADYEMIIKIREALAERAQATGRTQAVVLDSAEQAHWVEGGPYGFADTPGEILARVDGVLEADYPRPVVVDNPPDLHAALDAPNDQAALSDLAAQLRARAAVTGRVQAVVRDDTGELRWVEGGRVAILSLPEPGLEPGQPILLADDPRQRIVAQTEWTDVNPTDVAQQFPPEQFNERLVIPPTGDAIRLTPVARDDAPGTESPASGRDGTVSRSIAEILNQPPRHQPPRPIAATDGHPEVPGGFSHVDLPADLVRLDGLVYQMSDRVAGYAGSDQRMIELVRQVPGVKGAYLVDMHGDAAGPWDPTNPQSRLTVSEVRDLLVAAGWDGRQPVVLMSCDTAQSSYAADLAAELGVRVIAPTGRVWQVGDRVFICGIDPATGLPDLSKPGHWEEFGGDYPGPIAADEHGMPVLDAPHPKAAEADEQQVVNALRVLSDPRAHAPPVPRGEDGQLAPNTAEVHRYPLPVSEVEATGRGVPSDAYAEPRKVLEWDALSGGRDNPGSLESIVVGLKSRTDMTLTEKLDYIRDGLFREVGYEPSYVGGELDRKNLRVYEWQSGELYVHSTALMLDPQTTIEVSYEPDRFFRTLLDEAREGNISYSGDLPPGITQEQADVIAAWRLRNGLPIDVVDRGELASNLIDIQVKSLREALRMRGHFINEYSIEPHRVRLSYDDQPHEVHYANTKFRRSHLHALPKVRESAIAARDTIVAKIRGTGERGADREARARAVIQRLDMASGLADDHARYALLWVRDNRDMGAFMDTKPEFVRQAIETLRSMDPGRRLVLVGDDMFRGRPELRTAFEADGVLNGVDTNTLIRFWKAEKNDGRALSQGEQALFLHYLNIEHDVVQIGMESGALESAVALGVPTVYFQAWEHVGDKGSRWQLYWSKWAYGYSAEYRGADGKQIVLDSGQPFKVFQRTSDVLRPPLSTIRRVEFGIDLEDAVGRISEPVAVHYPASVTVIADRIYKLVESHGLDNFVRRLGHTGSDPWNQATWDRSRYYAEQVHRWARSRPATEKEMADKYRAIQKALQGMTDPFNEDVLTTFRKSYNDSAEPLPADEQQWMPDAYAVPPVDRGVAISGRLRELLGGSNFRQQTAEDLRIFRLTPAEIEHLREAIAEVLAARDAQRGR